MKEFKTKQSLKIVEAFESVLIAVVLKEKDEAKTDDDKLMLALFKEIADKLGKKLNTIQDTYTLKFSASQAFAIRILYIDYVGDPSTYFGNFLFRLSNQIHQYYQ